MKINTIAILTILTIGCISNIECAPVMRKATFDFSSVSQPNDIEIYPAKGKMFKVKNTINTLEFEKSTNWLGAKPEYIKDIKIGDISALSVINTKGLAGYINGIINAVDNPKFKIQPEGFTSLHIDYYEKLGQKIASFKNEFTAGDKVTEIKIYTALDMYKDGLPLSMVNYPIKVPLPQVRQYEPYITEIEVVSNGKTLKASQVKDKTTGKSLLGTINQIIESQLSAPVFILNKDKAGQLHAESETRPETKQISQLLLEETRKSQPSAETMKKLVIQGANVNTKDSNGDSLLLLALLSNKEDVALELLKLGADPNITNKSNFTPLMQLARKEYFQKGFGGVKVDKALITRGAHVNAVDLANKSALLYAAQAYNLPTMLELLDHDANVNAKNKENENALNLVAKWYLNQKEGFERRKKITEFNDLLADILETLIDYEININNQANDKTTALMLFTAAGADQAITKLLLSGADVNLKDAQGKKAIDYAKPGSSVYTILSTHSKQKSAVILKSLQSRAQ